MSILAKLVVRVSLVCVLLRPRVGLREHHRVAVEGHRQTRVCLHGHTHRLRLPTPPNPLLDLR